MKGEGVLSARDREVLRPLVERLAGAAASPVNAEREVEWQRLNDLEPCKPMLWITEHPWHEMDVDGELALACEGGWARGFETWIRRELYQWVHTPGDMIVSDFLACPISYSTTGYGIYEDAAIVRTDASSGIVSREYHRQIVEPEDIEKIKIAEVRRDDEGTEARFEMMERAFGDLMPVQRTGIKHIWYTPWDNLVSIWGVEEVFMDLIDRPEMVHAAIDRMVQSSLAELDQFEALNLLSLGSDNMRVGSGGYGYASDLPGQPFDSCHVRANNLWGCSNAQILSSVSADMTWEFAIEHDLPYLARWGLVYYGCCEPLDRKVDILRRIPNLRKISMSPWANVARAAEAVGRDYVLSVKPNPAIFVGEWSEEAVRESLTTICDEGQGCNVEIIMKDISTVQYHPERLWRWAEIAREVCDRA